MPRLAVSGSTVLDGRLRVESLIGEGRVGGCVYRARDLVSSEPVAVRTLHVPDELSGAARAEALARFEEEASLLARVSEASADAERLVAHGVSNGAPFCAFEWLEGQSLEAHLAEGGEGETRSLGEALTILEPAARALAAAHALGVAHGDVRPANLWLAVEDGRTRIKLTQFVLASRLRGASEPSFSPRFGAPEHFKPSYGEVGAATDVYGLALTLVELVSGRPALEGSDDAELYLATSDIKRRPTLRARGVEVGAGVEAVLQQALAVDPKRRFTDARAFWDALVAAVPELTPGPPSVRPQAEPAPPPPASRAESPAERAPDRTAFVAWVAVGLVGVVAAAVIAAKIAAVSPRPSSDRPGAADTAPAR